MFFSKISFIASAQSSANKKSLIGDPSPHTSKIPFDLIALLINDGITIALFGSKLSCGPYIFAGLTIEIFE